MINSRRARAVAPFFFAAFLLPFAAAPGFAQRADTVPDELEGVGIEEHLKEQVPLDLPFTDENGKEVTLRDYFDGDKPVILQLGYYRCPMLCGLVLNGLTDAMKGMDWSAGTKFTVLSVSIDPLETPALAKLKKQNYLKEYGRREAGAGWHFLVGPEKSIKALTGAVGFNYKWNEEREEFAHAAAIVVLTPKGTVSRYLYGVMFESKDVRLSLLEASEGKIGSTVDKIILFCHQYDPSSGTYTLAALNLMRFGAVLTLLVVGVTLLIFWRRETRRKHQEAVHEPLAEAGGKT